MLQETASLQQGWVIANHILVSFHVAFISSVLALPSASLLKGEVLRFVFLSHETVISALFMFVSFHAGIALHEMGHFLAALRLNALNDGALEHARRETERSRLVQLLKLFVLIPYGKAVGIKKEGLNYYADAPFNLAVAAAGPRASRNVALALLPPAAGLIAVGLILASPVLLNVGRLLLGIGIVALLDFRLADPGKYRAFRERERQARDKAQTVEQLSGWYEAVAQVKQRITDQPMQTVNHPRLGPVSAPWQFRNCGMGGRHTEKEYPESNVSMQEAMFLIIGARDYLEAQEMTVRLQTRLKEIIENEDGCRVMGIGLEGGLAPYIDRGSFPLPELRLWAMMKRAIEECGYRPGVDVAIALDPAASELEIAYRDEYEVPDAVGMYLFWRDEGKFVLDREAVLDVYVKAITEYEIPILSIEDGFAEDDVEGWKLLLSRLGDRVFVIGDDLVTTNDRTIELAAGAGLINAVLIKANQIGTLTETLLAMLVALGKGMQLVVSHRSKSPNDDMEGQIALAVNALGLKAGGGANTERLVKYQAVTEQMLRVADATGQFVLAEGERATVHRVLAYEEPTNAGIPTVGVTVELALRDARVLLRFRGATPLGTSAGTGEAIHLVDSLIERAEHHEAVDRFSGLLRQVEPGVFSFLKQTDAARVAAAADEALTGLYRRSQRYGGKGCLNAVDNVLEIIGPNFVGRDARGLTLGDIDRSLLRLELATARRRGKEVGDDRAAEVTSMQRKQNLGMNAILSVSLAMARAVAHVHGRELYELLREELIAIIEQLTATHGVPVAGTTFADYVAALRQVAVKLEQQGVSLYEELRQLTGIYAEGPRVRSRSMETARPSAAAAAPAAPAAPGRAAAAPAASEAGPASNRRRRPIAAEVAVEPEATRPAPVAEGDVLDEQESCAIVRVNEGFYRAYVVEESRNPLPQLRAYLEVKRAVASRIGVFGVVNNRIYRGDDLLVIPYLTASRVFVHAVRSGHDERVATQRFEPGALFTDAVIAQLVGCTPAALTAIDIEDRLAVVRQTTREDFRISRLGDIAALLKKVNDGVNRNEAVFWLRQLVARLCNLSVKTFVRAKNLQPEINLVIAEMVRLTNGPLGRRLPLLMRILVRNLPILIGKPNIIDRLWNDTIALAEVHVRGSAIINELRRTSHHSLGPRTLRIGRAYLEFLESGEDRGLRELGVGTPAQADFDARLRPEAHELVARVVGDLEELLGAAEIATRIRDWQESYVDAYMRCPFGNRLGEQAEVLVKKGIRDRSRWAYLHHLRILAQKAEDFGPELEVAGAFRAALDELEAVPPDDEAFDAAAAEQKVQEAVGNLISGLQRDYGELFGELDELLRAFDDGEHDEAFDRTCRVREQIAGLMSCPVFTAQRHHLSRCDCLLEELGYLALRHIAARHDEQGVDLEGCLRTIRACVLNLEHDGVLSQELGALSAMLVETGRSDAELLDILVHIERLYHKIRQRLTDPFEHMQARIGLDPEELRTVLANMQRYMHDLNSMVHFANIAETFIRGENDAGRRVRRAVDTAAGEGAGDIGPIIHISHRAEIARSIGRDPGGLNLRSCYGGKGSGLLYISYLRIPTRDGFILPTSIARRGLHRSQRAQLQRSVVEHLEILQADLERASSIPHRFGDPGAPVLLAVRGGSVFSMPGILSTVVFVGMNDEVAQSLAEDGAWRAYDSYRRFLASYASVVWGVDVESFDLVEKAKQRHGAQAKMDLSWEAMREVTEETKALLREQGFGKQLDEILSDPMRQLCGAVEAVMASWEGPIARRYREIKGLCDSWCTAVIVQEMAFGNRMNPEVKQGMDETRASLTGVIPRTRETDIGVRQLTGEIKFSAAGDDLVGGAVARRSLLSLEELQELMPMLHRRLQHSVAKLRRLMGTDQEIEFTVDRGVLSVLQARTAATRSETLQISFVDAGAPATRGLGVCGSGFRGLAAFSEEDLQELAAIDLGDRDDVDGTLMVLENPTPEDIPVIISADGVLTAKGGSTSHAAVAVNQIERRNFSAVMSAVGLMVNAKAQEAVIVDESGQVRHRIQRGDVVSINGTSGEVFVGSRRIDRPVKADSGSTASR